MNVLLPAFDRAVREVWIDLGHRAYTWLCANRTKARVL